MLFSGRLQSWVRPIFSLLGLGIAPTAFKIVLFLLWSHSFDLYISSAGIYCTLWGDWCKVEQSHWISLGELACASVLWVRLDTIRHSTQILGTFLGHSNGLWKRLQLGHWHPVGELNCRQMVGAFCCELFSARNFLWCWLGRTQSSAFDEKASMKKLRVASPPKTVFVLHTRPLALQKLSYDE